MIEPHPNQEANYEYLVELHKFAIGIIKEGVVASDVYDAIKRKVAAERAELAPCLPRSFGTSLGVEFGDAFLGFKPSCAGVLARNSVFSLALSFAKVPLEDASSSPTRPRGWYSLKITDTILGRRRRRGRSASCGGTRRRACAGPCATRCRGLGDGWGTRKEAGCAE